MDTSVPGYRRAKPVTRQDMERLKKGGQKAEAIKIQKEKHHEEEEIPEAEEQLVEALKKLNNH